MRLVSRRISSYVTVIDQPPVGETTELLWQTRPDGTRVLSPDNNLAELIQVANNPDTRHDVLAALLAPEHQGTVRAAAATHFATPFHNLIELMDDRDANVRAGVASNIKMNRHLLAVLATDPAVEVRVAVAKHPHVHPNTVSLLSVDTAVLVRAEAARSFRANPEVLARLANDEDSVVAGAASRNPRYTRHARPTG